MIKKSDLEAKMVSQWVQEYRLGKDVEENARRIFDLFYPQILAALRKRCPSPSDAEDLAQESFHQAFSRVSRLVNPGAFRSWLFAIAINLWRKSKQHRQRHSPEGRVVSIEDQRTTTEAGANPLLRSQDVSPEKETYEKERAYALDRAIARLSPQKRQIFHLRHEEGYQVRSIAVLMGLKEGTVKAHLAQIREIIRNELGDDVEGMDD